MKVKFVNVWDGSRLGYVKHIVLQVEESDTFLTEANFDPGYKFIITAVYHNVGAAGGHNFNPYHGNRARKLSRIIDYTESDVLGFYLDKVTDIYDIPQNLYTDTFWDVARTDGHDERSREELYSNSDSYFKVLHTGIYSFKELSAKLLDIADELKGELSEEVKGIVVRNERWMERMSELSAFSGKRGRPAEERKSIRLAIIDKNSLECVSDGWSTSAQTIVADYLWCPCDELPESIWEQVSEKNEWSFQRIYKTAEDEKID